jgi:glutaconate CoA-transferase subunit B
MEPDPVSKELTVVTIHPGTTRAQLDEATGWPLKYAANVGETPQPTALELEVLREIHAKTKKAHGA